MTIPKSILIPQVYLYLPESIRIPCNLSTSCTVYPHTFDPMATVILKVPEKVIFQELWFINLVCKQKTLKGRLDLTLALRMFLFTTRCYDKILIIRRWQSPVVIFSISLCFVQLPTCIIKLIERSFGAVA